MKLSKWIQRIRNSEVFRIVARTHPAFNTAQPTHEQTPQVPSGLCSGCRRIAAQYCPHYDLMLCTECDLWVENFCACSPEVCPYALYAMVHGKPEHPSQCDMKGFHG